MHVRHDGLTTDGPASFPLLRTMGLPGTDLWGLLVRSTGARLGEILGRPRRSDMGDEPRAQGRHRPSSRWIALGLLFHAGLAGASDVASADRGGGQAGPEVPEAQAVEILARYRYGAGESPILDVRWATEDSVYLLRGREGVHEHALEEGLPEKRLVLPGERQSPDRIQMQTLFAASSNRLVAAGMAGQFVWRERGARSGEFGATVRKLPGAGIGDMDLDGDDLALLGIPTGELFEKHSCRGVLWLSSLEDGLKEFDPIVIDKEADTPAELGRICTAYIAMAGSIRFTKSGDLLMFAAYEPTLKLLSTSGKVKREWDLVELGILDESFRLADVAPGGDVGSEIVAWSGRGTIVEDLASLGKATPLLLVRRRESARMIRELVRLEGDSVERFRLPLDASDGLSRVRLDVDNSGRLLLVVADRGVRIRERTAGGEVLVARLPW